MLDVVEHLGVGRHGGLLVIHDPEGFQRAAQCHRRVGIQGGVDLNDDIQVLTASLADRRHTLNGNLSERLGISTLEVVSPTHVDCGKILLGQARKAGVQLHCVIAIGYGVLCGVVVVFGVKLEHGLILFGNQRPPAHLKLRGIGPKGFVRLSSQELINRETQGLSLDVPAGNVNRRHSRANGNAAVHSPEGVAMEMFINTLRVKRVHSQDQLGEILAIAPGGRLAAAIGQPRLAKAADAFVGVDFDRNKRSLVALNAGDFHNSSSSFYPQFNVI